MSNQKTMYSKINPIYKDKTQLLLKHISDFSSTGISLVKGDRNAIKLFDLEGKTINVKSFKIPHLINKIAYGYFRKSKAKRSFEFATILLAKGIGTPEPIAFFENYNVLGLTSSFYVSEQLEAQLTFRELVEIPDYPENENILRQFTQFCYDLHEKGVEFLDHSPGNTLIKKNSNGTYDFFLVDLNRMKFHEAMTFEMRMKNLCRLTPKEDMVAVMSNEYAKYYDASEKAIFESLWRFTAEFQEKFYRKKRLKKKLKFWKS